MPQHIGQNAGKGALIEDYARISHPACGLTFETRVPVVANCLCAEDGLRV